MNVSKTTLDPKNAPLSSSARNKMIVIILAILMGLAIGLTSGYIWGSNQANRDNDTLRMSNTPPSPSPTIDKTPQCNKAECLFKQPGNDYLGFAWITGFYKQYDSYDWGNTKVNCDSLVTTGGSEKLVNDFKRAAKAGNQLNKFIDNNFLININLSDVSSEEKDLLLQSSPTNQVEIGVVTRVETGREVSTCYSVIDIISVKPLGK